MVITNGKDIYMTRGDSEYITVKLASKEGVSLPLETGDTVYFTIKKNVNTETKTLQKVVTTFVDGAAIVEIQPADTKAIEYGLYVYDIQVSFKDGRIRTIVPASTFELGGEVTYE